MVKHSAMMASPIRCLVTAGPTREFLDPVRFLSNPSSGKMGYALAAAAAARGWQVELISGPVSLPAPAGVTVERVVTGAEMHAAVRRRFPRCDILIMTAAILDCRPKTVADRKIKKHELRMVLEMEPVPDILADVARAKGDRLVVGFAAETDHLEEHARAKLLAKNADFIVANHIGREGGAFGSDTNTVLVLDHSGAARSFGPAPKDVLAAQLLELFAPRVRARGGPA